MPGTSSTSPDAEARAGGGPRLRRWLGRAARLALILGCLAYAFWGVDLAQVGASLARFDPLAVAGIVAWQFASFAIQGWRLAWLSGPEVGLFAGTRAALIGLGVNNVIPAKLGEVAKAVSLGRRAGFGSARGLSVVFWERFADVNALLVLGFSASLASGRTLAVAPMAAAVAAVWGALAVQALWPGFTGRLIGLVPTERLRLFAAELLAQVRGHLSAGRILALAGLTALVWLQWSTIVALEVNWMAGFELSPRAVLVVFAVSSLGMAVPSSPGAVGVFEAATVFALSLFGVPKEQALAAAVAMHMIQYLPVTVLGLGFFAGSGLSVAGLRKSI
jgi:uncharacterized membrane protein YbhN (UPF0104 family)